MRNALRYVQFWAKISSSQLAVADERYSFTYRELETLVRQSASFFKESGIKSGDLVVLNLNSVFNFIFSLTFNAMGVKTVVRNTQNALPAALDPDFFLSSTQPLWFSKERTILFDDGLVKKISKSKESDFLEGFRDESIPMMVWSTSGTTGTEKFFELDSRIFYNRIVEPTVSNFFPDDQVLNLLPYGAFWSTKVAWQSLLFGKPYLSFGYPDERILEVISRFSVKTVMGSPGQLARLLDDVESFAQENRKVPPISTFIVGGEGPSQKLVERLHKNFQCRVFNNYGSSEVGGIAHCEVITGNEPLIVRPFVDLEIVDHDDRPLPYGVEGRVRVRSNSLPSGYLQVTGESTTAFRHGFHYSGDVGMLDRNGNLILSGRSSNILNIAGSKIHPETIESQIATVPGIDESVALSWFNSTRGVEELALAIVVGSDFAVDKLESLLRAAFFSFGAVNIFKEAELAKNPGGKVIRTEMTRRVATSKPWARVVTSTKEGA